MKDILEKFGLQEFLSTICPGFVLLLSSLVWVDFKRRDIDWKALDSIVLGFGLLVLSYVFGILIANLIKLVRYWHKACEKRLWTAISEHEKRRARFSGLRVRGWQLLRFFVAIPHIPIQDSEESLLVLLEYKESLKGSYLAPEEFLNRLDRFEVLDLYRAFAAHEQKNDPHPLLKRADTMQARRLFAHGVGFAVMLIAVQVLFRLCESRPWILLSLLVIAAGLSLRAAAIQYWRDEWDYTRCVFEAARSQRL